MKIWLTRHGQTRLNKARLMQGRSDEPLNQTGILQVSDMRSRLLSEYPQLSFDAVYASPLIRAVKTASIIADVPPNRIITDERLLETDFGRYEQKKYWLLGPSMTLYWAFPELFRAPSSVESIDSMVSRSRSFLTDLQQLHYDNVLIACHGGIMRALSGCLEGRPRGIRWRPKPHNCEIRIYDTASPHPEPIILSLK